MQVEVNKLGKTLSDYKCPRCGYLHPRMFVKNRQIKRCYRCHHLFPQRGRK